MSAARARALDRLLHRVEDRPRRAGRRPPAAVRSRPVNGRPTSSAPPAPSSL
ncbi:hypothetical protein KCH_59190 [Kitasatospora cheerisanensis KCTC 2395]|uniref:Uncharacterized protein n=1 Tax=Kitasatospora cheerisanensis KCTC 2395 TaxID=1348663 RepID=A0A066YMM3_9ACTN|nr:hypothetical protein KCH_59190 [Kitasatospora cheerisanensis KCTC 2395]